MLIERHLQRARAKSITQPERHGLDPPRVADINVLIRPCLQRMTQSLYRCNRPRALHRLMNKPSW
jgi:hypothetical protein